jgi:hypothetical protein
VTIVGALKEAAGCAGLDAGGLDVSSFPTGPITESKYCSPPTPVLPDAGSPMPGRDAAAADAGCSRCGLQPRWGRPTLEAAAATSDFARELGLLSACPRADPVALGAVRVASPLAQAPDRDGHNPRARSAPALPLFRDECPRPKELGAKTAPTPLLASRDLLKCALKHISLCVFFRPARCWKCS